MMNQKLIVLGQRSNFRGRMIKIKWYWWALIVIVLLFTHYIAFARGLDLGAASFVEYMSTTGNYKMLCDMMY